MFVALARWAMKLRGPLAGLLGATACMAHDRPYRPSLGPTWRKSALLSIVCGWLLGLRGAEAQHGAELASNLEQKLVLLRWLLQSLLLRRGQDW